MSKGKTPLKRSSTIRVDISIASWNVIFEANSSGNKELSTASIEALVTDIQCEYRGSVTTGRCRQVSTALRVRIGHAWLFELSTKSGNRVGIPFLYFDSMDSLVGSDVSDRSVGINITDHNDISIDIDINSSGPDDEEVCTQKVKVGVILSPLVATIRLDMVTRWLEEFQSLQFSGGTDSSCDVVVDIDMRRISVVVPLDSALSETNKVNVKGLLTACNVIDDDGDLKHPTDRWFRRHLTLQQNCKDCYTATVANYSQELALKPEALLCSSGLMFRILLENTKLHMEPDAADDVNGITSGDISNCLSPPLVSMGLIHVFLRLEESNDDSGCVSVFPKAPLIFELRFLKCESSTDRQITLRKFSESDFEDGLTAASSVPLHVIPPAIKKRMTRKAKANASASEQSSHLKSGIQTNIFNRNSSCPSPPQLHGGDIFVVDSHRILLGK